jgi:hypothetical protein
MYGITINLGVEVISLSPALLCMVASDGEVLSSCSLISVMGHRMLHMCVVSNSLVHIKLQLLLYYVLFDPSE